MLMDATLVFAKNMVEDARENFACKKYKIIFFNLLNPISKCICNFYFIGGAKSSILEKSILVKLIILFENDSKIKKSKKGCIF